MIRRAFPLALALALAGCAGGNMLQPAPMPTIAAIEATEGQLAAINDPATFYKVGLLQVQEACGNFYDQAVLTALREAKTQAQANVLASLLTGSLALAGASGGATGGAALGIGAINSILTNQADYSLAGSDPAMTSQATAAEEAAVIAAMPPPTTPIDAYSAIFAVWRVCSPSGIKAMEEQAIAAAPNHLVVSGGASASALTPHDVTATPALPSVRVR